MGTVTAAISVSAAAAAVVSRPADRRRHRGPAAFRCSASAASERQALFSRIAPVYDHVRASCSPPSPLAAPTKLVLQIAMPGLVADDGTYMFLPCS